MNRLMLLSMFLAACGDDAGPSLFDAQGETDAQADSAPDDASPMVFETGFDDGTLPPTVTPGTGLLTPTQGYAPLGVAGNQFGELFLRSPTGNTVTLTITDLPPHDRISLAFLFAAIDSLDGTGSFPAGDFMRIDLDGVEIFRESFANATPDQIQSYEGPAAGVLARREDLGFQGPGSFYTDSAYDMGVDPRFQNLPHTGSTAAIAFTLEGNGVQSIDDESWAVDNLRVTVTSSP